jgi:hypothetical protein
MTSRDLILLLALLTACAGPWGTHDATAGKPIGPPPAHLVPPPPAPHVCPPGAAIAPPVNTVPFHLEPELP